MAEDPNVSLAFRNKFNARATTELVPGKLLLLLLQNRGLKEALRVTLQKGSCGSQILYQHVGNMKSAPIVQMTVPEELD